MTNTEWTVGRRTFDCGENHPCSDALVVSALGFRCELPGVRETTRDITPPAPSRCEFACGMRIWHGAIVAR